jgi:S-(hydroxymethyl)glutathione dehydrogenase/alcohol dehydrogenase
MSILCKAAITKGDGTYSIEEIAVADPQADEVLVKVMAAGLCHTVKLGETTDYRS